MRVLALRIAVLLAALAAALAAAVPAQARFVPGPGRGGRADADNPAAVVLKTAVGPGESFGGLEAPHTFNPLHGYPAAGYDTAGFTTVASGFAGVILGTTIAGDTVSLYCVDRNTDTEGGIGYDPGSWDLSKVPHLGYVLRILEHNFPAEPLPAGVTDARRAAAVQAAIWFFTDRFVLASTDVRFALTSQIVTAALAAGAEPEPHPSVAITGPASADTGAVAGPFAVTATTAEATLHVTGATLYSDPQAAHPLTNGAPYPVHTSFWLRAPEPVHARITATATVVNPIGRAFLYAPADPDDPTPAVAQKLILALAVPVRTVAEATVTVCQPVVEENEPGTDRDREQEGGSRPGESQTPETAPERTRTCHAATLARTGTDLLPLAQTALVFLVLGGVATVATRQSRRKTAA